MDGEGHTFCRLTRLDRPGAPVWVGSGADVASVASLLEIATGVIVGTAIKEDAQVTAPVSLERARAFVQAAR